MRNLKTFVSVAYAAITLTLLFDSCKKDLLVRTPKPVETNQYVGSNKLVETNQHIHYGREFASLDSTVRDSEMVITPYGPRLKSDVHLVPDGHGLKYSGTHLQEIEISTGKLIKDFGTQAPLKYLKANMQNNAFIGTKNINKTVDPVPASASWVTWAQTSTVKGGLDNGYSGNWTVPSLPTVTTDGQIIFIFVGLQDVNGYSIVQPIIQFGDNHHGGSNTTWSMSNAFSQCNSCSFYYSPYYPVASNAIITGSIQLSGTPGAQTVNCSITDNIHTSNLPVENAIYPFTTVYATLEQYFVTQASDYPPDSYVTMKLPLTQNLVPEVNDTPAPLFGEHTDVPTTGVGYAYLYFHPETIPTISYSSPVGYTVNKAISPLTPTVTGGNPTTTYSVSPGLPAGLTLNTSTGVISGTPTVVTEPNSNTYTVTATNGAGSGHTNIVMEIWAAPVLTVSYGGHSGAVIFSVTPNIPSAGTGVLYSKDLTTGQTNQYAGSPYGWGTSFTVGHTYQFYFVEWGANPPGPSPATSNMVQYTVN